MSDARRVLQFPGEPAVGDEALLARCADGDQGALGIFFDRHGDAVYRFLGRMGGIDGQDLGDLTQATFMKVPRAARRFDGRAKPRTWLFGIALNVARNYIRRDVRRKRMLRALGRGEPAPPRDPGREAAAAQAMRRLQHAIEALPLKLREVFVMCQIEGVPGVEAAAALGLPEGTVYRRLFTARQRVRAALEGVR